jgi:leader peptidase (prepilin peptidase)/N-methyltransferase
MAMIVLLLLLVGLCLGSFINALVWRLHSQAEITDKRDNGKKLTQKDTTELAKLSISKGRSMCFSCKHELAPKDLVPVISWLSLGGRCRYCRAKIPDTPITELLTPVLFIISWLYWPETLHGIGLFQFILWLGFIVGFIALAIYDIRWYLLPDRIVWPLVTLAVIYRVGTALYMDSLSSGLSGLWGILCIAGLFFVLFLISRQQWIGFGDVKLGLVLGLLVGGPLASCLLLFIASVTGSLIALPLLVQQKADRRSVLPFGPLLLFGCLITVLFGGSIIDWYRQLLIPS